MRAPGQRGTRQSSLPSASYAAAGNGLRSAPSYQVCGQDTKYELSGRFSQNDQRVAEWEQSGEKRYPLARDSDGQHWDALCGRDRTDETRRSVCRTAGQTTTMAFAFHDRSSVAFRRTSACASHHASPRTRRRARHYRSLSNSEAGPPIASVMSAVALPCEPRRTRLLLLGPGSLGSGLGRPVALGSLHHRRHPFTGPPSLFCLSDAHLGKPSRRAFSVPTLLWCSTTRNLVTNVYAGVCFLLGGRGRWEITLPRGGRRGRSQRTGGPTYSCRLAAKGTLEGKEENK